MGQGPRSASSRKGSKGPARQAWTEGSGDDSKPCGAGQPWVDGGAPGRGGLSGWAWAFLSFPATPWAFWARASLAVCSPRPPHGWAYAHHLSPESGPACDVGAGTIIAPYKDQAALKDRAGLSKAKWSRRRSLSCGIPRIKWSAGCSGQDRQIFSRGRWISKRLAGFGELLVNPTSDTAGIKICVELR